MSLLWKESSGIDGLIKLMVDNKLSKIPIYKEKLDYITGIIHTGKVLPALLTGALHKMTLKEVGC
ncbi:MAG: hypothetical protein MZV70_42025 [Desulfobacterales bacterium]|nr:hypothetical protein [Desulfobacterales bacterium]